MIYALYISCIFAPFSTPIQCENSIFVCVCVLQDCSRERLDCRSHLRQEQFSQHKIQKSAGKKKFSQEPNWPSYQLRKCISSQRL